MWLDRIGYKRTAVMKQLIQWKKLSDRSVSVVKSRIKRKKNEGKARNKRPGTLSYSFRTKDYESHLAVTWDGCVGLYRKVVSTGTTEMNNNFKT